MLPWRWSLVGVLLAPGTAIASEEHVQLDLRGTWGMELSVVNEVQLPLLGKTEVVSRQTMRLEVTQGVDGIQVHQVPCGLVTDADNPLVKTRFPQPFLDALPTKDYPLVVYRDGTGWRVEGDLQPQYLGYDPALSPSGPPREPDHPAIVDTDGDGVPGITVLANAPFFGDIQLGLAQVAHTRIHGRVAEDGSIQGQAESARLEQWVVVASNRLFRRNPALTPRSDLSTFHMRRVPADTPCSDLQPSPRP